MNRRDFLRRAAAVAAAPAVAAIPAAATTSLTAEVVLDAAAAEPKLDAVKMFFQLGEDKYGEPVWVSAKDWRERLIENYARPDPLLDAAKAS